MCVLSHVQILVSARTPVCKGSVVPWRKRDFGSTYGTHGKSRQQGKICSSTGSSAVLFLFGIPQDSMYLHAIQKNNKSFYAVSELSDNWVVQYIKTKCLSFLRYSVQRGTAKISSCEVKLFLKCSKRQFFSEMSGSCYLCVTTQCVESLKSSKIFKLSQA